MARAGCRCAEPVGGAGTDHHAQAAFILSIAYRLMSVPRPWLLDILPTAKAGGFFPFGFLAYLRKRATRASKRRDPARAVGAAMGPNYRPGGRLRSRYTARQPSCTRRARASVGPLRDTSKPRGPRTVPVTGSVHPWYHDRPGRANGALLTQPTCSRRARLTPALKGGACAARKVMRSRARAVDCRARWL